MIIIKLAIAKYYLEFMMSAVFDQPDFKQGNLLRGIVNCSGAT